MINRYLCVRVRSIFFVVYFSIIEMAQQKVAVSLQIYSPFIILRLKCEPWHKASFAWASNEWIRQRGAPLKRLNPFIFLFRQRKKKPFRFIWLSYRWSYLQCIRWNEVWLGRCAPLPGRMTFCEPSFKRIMWRTDGAGCECWCRGLQLNKQTEKRHQSITK